MTFPFSLLCVTFISTFTFSLSKNMAMNRDRNKDDSHNADCMQVDQGQNGPEQPLAVPTISNSISTRLPAGQGIVVLYARYFDSAITSPLGLPAGARVTSEPLNIQPLINAVSATGRRLQGMLPYPETHHSWISGCE